MSYNSDREGITYFAIDLVQLILIKLTHGKPVQNQHIMTLMCYRMCASKRYSEHITVSALLHACLSAEFTSNMQCRLLTPCVRTRTDTQPTHTLCSSGLLLLLQQPTYAYHCYTGRGRREHARNVRTERTDDRARERSSRALTVMCCEYRLDAHILQCI